MISDSAVSIAAFFSNRGSCTTSAGELKSLMDFSDKCLEMMKGHVPEGVDA